MKAAFQVALACALLLAKTTSLAAEPPSLDAEVAKVRERLRAMSPSRPATEVEREAQGHGQTNFVQRQFREAYYATNLARAKELLREHPWLANSAPMIDQALPRLTWGHPWLDAASLNPRGDMVALLLAHGAKASFTNQARGWDRRPSFPLQHAAFSGSADIVAQLLAAGAEVNEQNNQGQTALGAALGMAHSRRNGEAGHDLRGEPARMAAVALLLRHGADLFAPTSDRSTQTPLDLALALERPEWLDVVFTNTLQATRRHTGDDTLLHLAARNGRFHIFQKLIVAGTDPNATNATGLTAWHLWAKASRLAPTDLKQASPPEPRGYFVALSMGAKFDAYITAGLGETNHLAELLAARPALLNEAGPLRQTLLHWAADAGRDQTVGWLLRRGADSSFADHLGETALHLAASHGYLEVVRTLIDAGAPLDTTNRAGATALRLAAREGRLEVVELLLSKPQARRVHPPQATALHEAVSARHLPVVLRLLDAGLPVDAQDEAGRTALHRAAVYPYAPKVLEALLARTPRTDIRDWDGRTALESALAGNVTLAAGALLVHNARAVAGAANAATPLHYAARNGNLQMVEQLLLAGAEVMAKDEHGLSPFFHAATNGHLRVADLLVRNGANPSEQDRNGNTALNLARTGHTYAPGAFPGPDPAAALQGLRLREGVAALVRWLDPHSQALRDPERAFNGMFLGVPPIAPPPNPPQLAWAQRMGASIAALAADRNWNLRESSMRTDWEHWSQWPWKYCLAAGTDAALTNHQGQSPLHVAAADLRRFVGYRQSATNFVGQLVRAGARLEGGDTNGATPLHLAAAAAETNLMSALLGAGASLTATNRLGQLPLHLAAVSPARWNEMSPAALLLVSAGSPLSPVDAAGDTPLHIAIRANRLTARALIHAGAERHAKNAKGETPFRLAHQWMGMNEPFQPPDVQSGLIEALKRSDYQTVRRYLEWEPKLANTFMGWYDIRPLYWPVQEGDLEMVRLLLSFGADANGDDPENPAYRPNVRPIHLAVATRRPAMARLLIQHGAQIGFHEAATMGFVDQLERMAPEARKQLTYTRGVAGVLLTGTLKQWDWKPNTNACGGQPLYHAVCAGQTAAVKWLLEHGAYPNTPVGHSPLFAAASRGHEEIVGLLERHGAKWDVFTAISLGDTNRLRTLIKGTTGWTNSMTDRRVTPLGWAAAEGQLAAAVILLEAGAPVNGLMPCLTPLLITPELKRGYSPLHQAVVWNRLEIARSLLRHGGDPNQPDPQGHTPLHYAATLGLDEMVQLLLNQGADPNARQLPAPDRPQAGWATSDGVTPLHCAAYFENTNTVALLLAKWANPSLTNAAGRNVTSFLESGLNYNLTQAVSLPADSAPAMRRSWGGLRPAVLEQIRNHKMPARDQSTGQSP